MLLKEKLSSMSTIEVYELVLNKKISRFPEFFWSGEDGKQRGLECLEYLLFSKLNWTKEDVPTKFSKSVLEKNKLAGMLTQCFHNSPLECIMSLMKDAYQPWEYNITPTNYWTKEHAQFATKYMINKLNWNNDDIKTNLSANTFKSFGLLSMLRKIYNGSPFNAINDVFPNRFQEWELNNTPRNFWNDKNNCKNAIEWLLYIKLKNQYKHIPIEEMRVHFKENGLDYMLQRKFNNSVKKALDFVEIYDQKECA